MPALTWTEAMDRELCARWRREPMQTLVARFGRSRSSLYQRARKLKLPRKSVLPFSRSEIAAVRRLHRVGLNDAEIARRLGGRFRDHRNVCTVRHKLGLPKNEEAIYAAQLRAIAAQRRRLGIKNSAELRSRAFRRFAVERGWPEGLRPREVQILEFLAVAGGPADRWTIAKAIGFNMNRCRGKYGQRALLSSGCSRRLTIDGHPDRGSYLANLMVRGLVIDLGRRLKFGPGKGQSRHVYTLSPAAIAVVTQRSRRCEATTA